MYEIILIVFIVTVSLYIMWRLMSKQNITLDPSGNNTSQQMIPNMIVTPDSELATVQNTTPVTLLPYPTTTYGSLSLKQFVIKGSYNSAITGNFVNKDMVKYILQRGCRYLDFELFLLNTTVVVSYSTDPSFNVLLTDNTVPFTDILETLVSNLDKAPNKTDPLFLNMRIKSNDSSIYKKIASIFHNNFGSTSSKLYSGTITIDTLLSTLGSQIIIMIDNTINPNYAASCACPTPTTASSETCYNLTDYINMETGTLKGNNIRQQSYTSILNQCWNTPKITNTETDVSVMLLIVPDPVVPRISMYKNPPIPSIFAKTNPPFPDFIKRQGCQLVPYRFYLPTPTYYLGMTSGEPTLKQYEDFFDAEGSAFVPLAIALTDL